MLLNLLSRATVGLFTALKDNNKLNELDIAINEITDNVCDAITQCSAEEEQLLALLGMHGNL